MVRNLSIKELILNLKENLNNIQVTQLEYSKSLKANKKSSIQMYQVHLKSLLKKRNFLLNLFRSKLQGKIIRLYYKYKDKDTKEFINEEALLVNLSKEEAIEILTLGCRMKGYNIEILECNEISTFLSKGKL